MADAPRLNSPRRWLRICGTTRWPPPGCCPLGTQAQGQDGDQREQARTGPVWCGRWPGPTTGVGFPAPDGLGLLKGDLDRPAHHDPGQDLLRVACRSVQKKAAIRNLPSGSPDQDKANRHRGQPGGVPQGGAREDPEPFALAPVPVHVHRLPGGIGAGRPDLAGCVGACPLVGLRPRLPGGVGCRRMIQRGIQAQARDHGHLLLPHTPAPAPRRQSRHRPPTPAAAPGSQRRTCFIICRTQSTLVLCRRWWRAWLGQHSAVRKGNAQTRWAQGTGTKSIITTHFRPKQWMTCFLEERTASR